MAAQPANNLYPVLDGITPSWADVLIAVTPVDAPLISIDDIKSFNSGRSVDLGQSTVGGRLKRRTWGAGKQDASMTLYYEGYLKLIRGLKDICVSKGLMRGNTALIRGVHFGINYSFSPVGSSEIFERRVKGACVISDPINGSEGTDAITVDVGLSCAEIVQMVDGVEVALI